MFKDPNISDKPQPVDTVSQNPKHYKLDKNRDVSLMIKEMLEECQQKGLTPLDIEQATGVSYRTMRYWCKGRTPKLANLMYLAIFLDYQINLFKKKK